MTPNRKFDTVRGLEKHTFRTFSYGGGALAIGMALTFVGLPVFGVPLLLISAVVLVAVMAWVSLLGKEPTKSVYCPICACANDVYQSRQRFSCDMCGQSITFSDQGEPMPTGGREL